MVADACDDIFIGGMGEKGLSLGVVSCVWICKRGDRYTPKGQWKILSPMGHS